MKRLGTPLGLLFAMMALVSGCGAAAEPPVPDEQRQFVDQLTWMMLGDKDEVEVSPGYELADTVIVDEVDRDQSPFRQVRLEAAKDVFAPLDPLYRASRDRSSGSRTSFTYPVEGKTEDRIATARRILALPVGQPDDEDLTRNYTAVSLLTYQEEGSGRPRLYAPRLQFGRTVSSFRVSRVCELHVSRDHRTYVKSVVATLLLPPSGEMNLESAESFDCLFAAQIYSVGLHDAVVTGRFRQFPRHEAEMEGCLVLPARSRRPAPLGLQTNSPAGCFSPIRGTSQYAVLDHLVSHGLLRPGRVRKEDFRQSAFRAIAAIGWSTLVATDEYERTATRRLGAPPRTRP